MLCRATIGPVKGLFDELDNDRQELPPLPHEVPGVDLEPAEDSPDPRLFGRRGKAGPRGA